MELIYRNSFLRDWKNSKSKKLTKSLKILIDKIKSVNSAEQIPRLKKLRSRNSWHKIEVHTSKEKFTGLCALFQEIKLSFSG